MAGDLKDKMTEKRRRKTPAKRGTKASDSSDRKMEKSDE
jgi:hypothetical protein